MVRTERRYAIQIVPDRIGIPVVPAEPPVARGRVVYAEAMAVNEKSLASQRAACRQSVRQPPLQQVPHQCRCEKLTPIIMPCTFLAGPQGPRLNRSGDRKCAARLLLGLGLLPLCGESGMETPSVPSPQGRCTTKEILWHRGKTPCTPASVLSVCRGKQLLPILHIAGVSSG